MSKPTTDSRGRRYTPAQREEVLHYIAHVNREKGRGGQLAAHRKFGIALLTLKLWMKHGPGVDAHPSASHEETTQALHQLASLSKKIGTLEDKLSRMRYDYERLKQRT